MVYYEVVESLQQIGQFIKDLEKVNTICLDIETNSLNIFTCKLYTIQIKVDEKVYVFDFTKFPLNRLEYLCYLIESKKIVGHNLKYDLSVLKYKTKISFNNLYDTQLVEAQLNLGIGERYYSLEDLVKKYTGRELNKEIRKQFYETDIVNLTEQQIMYGVEDVLYLEEIKNKQLIEAESTGQDRIIVLENKLLPVVINMELEGIDLNIEKWKELIKGFAEKTKDKEIELQNKIIDRVLDSTNFNNLLELLDSLNVPVKTKRDRSAYEQITDKSFYKQSLLKQFNTSSPKQMVTALNIIGIKTESTNEKVLKELELKDEVLELIFEFREFSKKVSSFGDTFLDKINPITGRIHANLVQIGPATGRFACDTPNLQQIPREKEYRSCFIAPKGYKLITLDFNQQEYRLAGALTGEERIIESYAKGIDMHTLTASLVYGVDVKDVKKEQRQIAKSINFAILYGSTEYGLAYNFKMSIDEAKEILNKFYGGYPQFTSFKNAYENLVAKNKYSVTALGRRRYFDVPISFKDSKEYQKYISKIKREGFNQFIQGTGADITKLSLVSMYNNNPFSYGDFAIILPVHDEIMVRVKEDIAEDAYKFMEYCMTSEEQKFLGRIPAKVEGKISDVWEH